MKDIPQNILIFGFSHSGTNILKTIMAKSPSVLVSSGSKELMSPTDDLIKEAANNGIAYTLVKATQHTARKKDKNTYLPDAGNGYKTVFIMRDPAYIYSSINRRFQGNIPSTHQFAIYEKVATWFTQTRMNNTPNFYHIKYEDMFSNNYEKLMDLFKKLGIEYSMEMVSHGNKSDQSPPAHGSYHNSFRQWQLTQPFENMNCPSKLQLTPQQRDQILQSDAVRMLGYGWGF